MLLITLMFHLAWSPLLYIPTTLESVVWFSTPHLVKQHQFLFQYSQSYPVCIQFQVFLMVLTNVWVIGCSSLLCALCGSFILFFYFSSMVRILVRSFCNFSFTTFLSRSFEVNLNNTHWYLSQNLSSVIGKVFVTWSCLLGELCFVLKFPSWRPKSWVKPS